MASQYRRRSLMLNTIAKVAQGNPTIITDSSSRRLQKLNVYGQSEQDSTTGKNLLNPTGATKVGWNIELPNFRLEVGKQYTYTAPILEGSKACGLFVKANNTQLAPYLQSRKTHTFTVPEEADFSQGILLAGGSEDALTLGDELTAMVELGSVATEFEPYTGGKPSPSPDYPQEIISKQVSEIKVTGKNLLDFTKVHRINSTDNPYTMLENGYVLKRESNNDARISVIPCKLKKGQSYFLTFDSNFIAGEEENVGCYLPQIGQYISSNTHPFTPNEDVNEIGIYLDYKLNAAAQVEITNIQVEFGSAPTSYEPYKSQTVTLSEPITLMGIPVDSGGNVTIDGQQYISDVICEKDGVIGVERNCVVLDVDSSQTGIYQNINNNYKGFYKNSLLPEIMNRRKGFGNYIQVSTSFSFEDTSERVILGANVNTIYFIFSSFYDESLEDKGLSNFQSFLDEHDVKIVTYITEPTFEPLPEEIQAQYKALKSYYPNTVIQTGCWNEVTYSAKRGG